MQSRRRSLKTKQSPFHRAHQRLRKSPNVQRESLVTFLLIVITNISLVDFTNVVTDIFSPLTNLS
jgi:hypothetical protein